MKTQTRLILCAAIFALALLALASVPLGTQGRSTQFLRVGAGNTNEGISHPFVSGSVLAEDPDNPIDMKGITTGPRTAPTPPADPDRPIPMDHIDKAAQLDKYCMDKRRLYDTLKDLRARKEYDKTKGTCIYQVGLKEKIRIVIEALINCEGYIGTLDEELRRRSEPIDSSENCPPPTTTPSVGAKPGAGPGGGVGPGKRGSGGTKSGGTETGGTNSGGGLKTVKFETQHGHVTVNVPDDMMAGDTISGTVFAEPKGNTNEERAKNMAELHGYVVEIKTPDNERGKGTKPLNVMVPLAGATASLGSTVARYRVVLPEVPPGDANLKQRSLEVNLRRTTGTSGASDIAPPQGTILIATNNFAPPQGNIIVSPQGNIAPPLGVVIAENNFVLPKIAQQGRPVEIHGPFDGSFENTKVNVGGEEVPLLAESPRKAVFKSPSNTTGPAEIVVREGKTETKGEYRNVGVNLSAPKTSLLKGESTTLKIEVSGLQGIKEPVPLHLVKGGVVNMQDGDVQTMSIKPAEVQSNGTFTTTRKITGVQAGVWSATATVVVFDVCLQDDNNGNTLIFSSDTGDFCAFAPGLNIAIADARGGGVISSGSQGGNDTKNGTFTSADFYYKFTKNGTFTSADFNFAGGTIHVDFNPVFHTGSALVQMTKPKQTFTITDRDTRNNTCACK